MRPLLIGQAPGPRSDPLEPLAGRCGARLAGLCGIELGDFLRQFERVNLLHNFPGKAGKGDAFPLRRAREGMTDLLRFEKLERRRVVLLGDNVAKTFYMHPWSPNYPLLKFAPGFLGMIEIAVCPHPSGINRWWNEPANVRRAKRFWRALAKEAIDAER